MKATMKRGTLWVVAVSFVMGVLAGCSYVPEVKDGTCWETRQWVPPQKNDKGEWEEGHCDGALQ